MSRRILTACLIGMTAGCGADYGDFPGSSPPPASRIAETADESATRTPDEVTGVPPANVQRKIIYTATIELIVPDFADAEKQLAAMIERSGGYVARFEEGRRSGARLSGRWVVRLPVDQFNPFLEQTAALGVPTSRSIEAQDVTEQYIDLSARQQNKQRLEQRLLKLLDERTGEIKDVIEVESQLGRVREEIELIEGKLRYLSDRIAMSTITISVSEDRGYEPPQAPTFTAKVTRTFSISIDALRTVGEALVLAIVATAPWLLVAVIAFAPVGLVIRRVLRR